MGETRAPVLMNVAGTSPLVATSHAIYLSPIGPQGLHTPNKDAAMNRACRAMVVMLWGEVIAHSVGLVAMNTLVVGGTEGVCARRRRAFPRACHGVSDQGSRLASCQNFSPQLLLN